MNPEQRKDIKDRKDQAFKMWEYAIQRIDLLIISICGAGIYVTLETLKYIKDNSMEGSSFVKIAGGFFLIAIIINFVSQFLGKKANEKEIALGNAKLDADIIVTENQQNEIGKIDSIAENYSKWTDRLNIASLIGMFIGLGFLIYYFMKMF